MRKLVPLIADTIDTTVDNIFYKRQLTVGFEFPRWIKNTKWRCMFHGIGDCAVTHDEDGRHLEIPFGLNSRYDHVSGGGTLMYIMSSKTPWPEYPELKQFFAKEDPPYDRFSGSHEKMVALTKQINQLPLFQESDSSMTEQKEKLAGKDPYINQDGEVDLKLFHEYAVCDWLVLNQLGQTMIQSGLPKKDFYQLWKEAGFD